MAAECSDNTESVTIFNDYVESIEVALQCVREYEISTGAKFVGIKGPSSKTFGCRPESIRRISNGN